MFHFNSRLLYCLFSLHDFEKDAKDGALISPPLFPFRPRRHQHWDQSSIVQQSCLRVCSSTWFYCSGSAIASSDGPETPPPWNSDFTFSLLAFSPISGSTATAKVHLLLTRQNVHKSTRLADFSHDCALSDALVPHLQPYHGTGLECGQQHYLLQLLYLIILVSVFAPNRGKVPR